MARKSGFTDFVEAFNKGYDTVNKVGKDYEMGKLATEKETPAFTAGQGQDLEAMANAKDENGNPYYTLGTDAQGKYTIAPNFKNETGAAPADYAPSTMAAQGVQFMGKQFDQPLTDSQRNNTRQQAMAGVMDKYGDAEGAMRYRTQAKQGELADLQLSQATRQNAREDKMDVNQALLDGIDKDTGAADLVRRTGPDGVVRDMTVDDHLHASQVRAGLLVKAGKMAEAGNIMKDINAQAFAKIQLDSVQRDQDLGRAASAMGSGDLSGIKDFYNKHVPDGARVLDVAKDDKGNIVIKRETNTGTPMPDIVKSSGELIAGLNSFKNPNALYEWSQSEFKNTLAINADKRADKQIGFEGQRLALDGQRLGLEGARLGLAQSEAARGRGDVAAGRTAAVAYETARQNGDDAGMKKATLAIIQAGGSAPGATSASDPAEVKLARAMVNAGLAPDMKVALERAISKSGASPADMHQSFVASGIKNMDSAENSVKKADDVMTQMGYTKSGGRWTAAGGGAAPGGSAQTFVSVADVEAAAKSGKVKKGDKVIVNGKTATWQ